MNQRPSRKKYKNILLSAHAIQMLHSRKVSKSICSLRVPALFFKSFERTVTQPYIGSVRIQLLFPNKIIETEFPE
jgi:hypothetical protein